MAACHRLFFLFQHTPVGQIERASSANAGARGRCEEKGACCFALRRLRVNEECRHSPPLSWQGGHQDTCTHFSPQSHRETCWSVLSARKRHLVRFFCELQGARPEKLTCEEMANPFVPLFIELCSGSPSSSSGSRTSGSSSISSCCGASGSIAMPRAGLRQCHGHCTSVGKGCAQRSTKSRAPGWQECATRGSVGDITPGGRLLILFRASIMGVLPPGRGGITLS